MNTIEKMKIKAIAPWFGGKRNLAKTIIQMLGKHNVYWEIFCGSMAVLLLKPSCIMETVNDLNGDLINLARVLQNEKTALQLYSKLNRTLMCETLHREAAQRYHQHEYSGEIKIPDLNRAYDYFLCSWLGRNGVAGTKSYNQGFCVRYTSNGGHASKRFKSVIESIPAWHYRLMNVTILCRDAFELLKKIEDKEGTVIYADPPYIEKGAKYIHDFEESDHNRLAEALNRFKKTKIILSYYDHPKLDCLYEGWEKLRIEVSKSIAHQNKRGNNKTRAIEVILINKKIGGLFDG